jgi:hypothetical protein
MVDAVYAEAALDADASRDSDRPLLDRNRAEQLDMAGASPDRCMSVTGVPRVWCCSFLVAETVLAGQLNRRAFSRVTVAVIAFAECQRSERRRLLAAIRPTLSAQKEIREHPGLRPGVLPSYLVLSVWEAADMLDSILVAIAASLADKSAASLYDFVKSAFTKRPAGLSALSAAEGAAPESPEVYALAEELQRVEAADPAFHDELRSKWAETVSATGHADHGGTVNQISGHVGKAVQARDIHGGITL